MIASTRQVQLAHNLSLHHIKKPLATARLTPPNIDKMETAKAMALEILNVITSPPPGSCRQICNQQPARGSGQQRGGRGLHLCSRRDWAGASRERSGLFWPHQHCSRQKSRRQGLKIVRGLCWHKSGAISDVEMRLLLFYPYVFAYLLQPAQIQPCILFMTL